MASVGEWVEFLEGLFPAAWAEEWDNPGLQLGDRGQDVEHVMVALDPTPDVIREAGDRHAELLLTHHPLLMSPVRRVDLADPKSAAIEAALRLGVAVAACHTNADVANPGVTDALCELLGIEVTGTMVRTGAGSRVKLVTFVPTESTHAVIEGLARAGAGVIGEYEVCSFRTGGVGTFLPTGGAAPRKGKKKVVNEVSEDRLEMVVPREASETIIAELREAHPYEEPAVDLYELAGPTDLGLGRVGEARECPTAGDLADRCREELRSEVRLIGDPSAEIRTVAACAGSGGGLVGEAVESAADVYVTGDVRHHHALEARATGLPVIDAGHFGTEWPFVESLAGRLRQDGPKADVEVSETNSDPFAK